MKLKAAQKALVPRRMHHWIESQMSSPHGLPPPLPTKTRRQQFMPEALCGTYLLLTSAEVPDDLKRSEIIISFSPIKNSLYGRYRHGEDVHGLFRTNCLPRSPSTRPIPCVVAVEDAQLKDGTWVFDVCPPNEPYRYPPPDLPLHPLHAGGIPLPLPSDKYRGVTFLSDLLIVLGPHFLGHRADLDPEGEPHAAFGVKVNDYHEDIDALKESWEAIHGEYCRWYHPNILLGDTDDGENEDADADVDAAHWRGGDFEPDMKDLSPEWDEELIDGLVNQLYRQE